MSTDQIWGVAVRNPQIVSVGRQYGVTIATCVTADPESKGGSEATVRVARADLVPTDHNLRAAAEAPCGPGVLATRVRAIAEARHRHDPPALRGALIDLAAAALSWADAVGTVLPPEAQRQSAA